MLEGVGLRRAHDGEGHRLVLALLLDLDRAADGDGHDVAGAGGHLGGGEDLANLGDAGGVLGLLLLGVIVLGVLGQVAEVSGYLDALDDLGVVLSLAPGELLDELLTASGVRMISLSAMVRFLA